MKKPNYCQSCVIEGCGGFTQKEYKRCPLGIIIQAERKGVPIRDITHPPIYETIKK